MGTELRNRDFTASDISSPARIEDLDTYEDTIEEFREEGWTYIPMPGDSKYYNVEEGGKPQDLVDDQCIRPNLHILDVMEKLLDHPFLLIEDGDDYEIIHLSNLNKREVKHFLYPVLSNLAYQLSQRIEDYYTDSEDLTNQVSEFTVGTWYKAKQDDVELHIGEFLTLGNMIGIIKGHGPLMEKCEFDSNDDVDKLGGIEKLRNRVMHGNRTLVNDRQMLDSHIDRIERAEKIVRRLT